MTVSNIDAQRLNFMTEQWINLLILISLIDCRKRATRSELEQATKVKLFPGLFKQLDEVSLFSSSTVKCLGWRLGGGIGCSRQSFIPWYLGDVSERT